MRTGSRFLDGEGGQGQRAWGVVAIVGFAASLLMMAAAAPAGAAEAPRFLVLAPTETQLGTPADLLIAVSLIDPDHQIDAATVRLLVDGKDVTSSAQVSAEAVTYVPDPPLAPGAHRFELRARTMAGGEVTPVRREFRAGEVVEGERSWAAQGQFVLDFLADDLSGAGRGLRQQPDRTSTARLRLGGKVSGWKYDGLVFLTSDEDRSFQPRDRYSFHLDRGWVGLDAGDVNYSFSPLVLQGKRTRGLGGYLRVGEFEVTALRGAINRKAEGTLEITPAQGDSIPADSTVLGGTYQRDLIGVRLAFGRGRGFQFGLDGLRVRDDIESVRFGLLPKDNLVVGGNLLLAPLGRRLIAEGNWALSFLTDDITGGAISDSLVEARVPGADLPFDPKDFEDLFIINLTTTPLDPRKHSNLAWETGLKGNLAGHVFRAGYRRVGSVFQSLGVPSLQNDKAGVRVTDSFRMLRRRLEFSGEYEGFSDNLSDDKDFTTDTRILGGAATFLPGRVDIKNVTMGVRVYRRENGADAPADSTQPDLRVDETTTTFRVGTGYHFWFRQGHELALSYLHAKTDALQPQADAVQADWNLGWTTRFEHLPLTLEGGLGTDRTEYPESGAELTYTSVKLGGTYGLLRGRLDTFGSFSLVTAEGKHGLAGGDKTTWDVGARYRVASRSMLSTRLGLVRFRDESASGRDYDEKVLNLRLVQDF